MPRRPAVRLLYLVWPVVLFAAACGKESSPAGPGGPPPCGYALSADSQSFDAGGGTGSVGVSTRADCAWASRASASWLLITAGDSGIGDGTVSYSVAADTGVDGRSAWLLVAGDTFDVAQRGVPCSYVLAPDSQSFGAAGGEDSVSLGTRSGCPWTARSDSDWLVLLSDTSGRGPGVLGYSVAKDTTAFSRTGALLIVGDTFRIRQQGVPCSYAIAPDSQWFEAAGDTGSVGVSAPVGCSWSARSDAGWVTVTAGASGSGPGRVAYAVAADTSIVGRSGALLIVDDTFAVRQHGVPCVYTIAPDSQSFPTAGGSGSVSVSAHGGCLWTAQSNANWISVTAGTGGSGDGTVSYTVAANTDNSVRAGGLTIAGQPFTVTQQGVGAASVRITGAGVTDSIEAELSAPLTIQVLDSTGTPIPGVTVALDSILREKSVWGYAGALPFLQVEPPGATGFTATYTDTTNASGEVSVRVRLGPAAGGGGVIVRVPVMQFVDTARYSILPGAPYKLFLSPGDTGIVAGASFRYGSTVWDRYENRITGAAISYSTTSSVVSVDDSGTVSGLALGRATIDGTAGDAQGSSHVSVVPRGSLVADVNNAIVLMNLDGTGRRVLASVTPPNAISFSAQPRWSPAGDHVVYVNGLGNMTLALFTTDLNGNANRLMTNDDGCSGSENIEDDPVYSPGGQYIYYSKRVCYSASLVRWEIWRVPLDGSSPERVSPQDQSGPDYYSPTLSPDGRFLAYLDMTTELPHILDLSTGQVRELSTTANAISWSPVADTLALSTTFGISLAAADGSSTRTVAQMSGGGELSWSSDGQWLLRGSRLLQLSTGLVIYLPAIRSVGGAALRPN